MDATNVNTAPARARRRWTRSAWTACGALAAATFLGGFGEVYARLFPPRDCHAFLGEESPLTGSFVADDDFGLAYRSWQAFLDNNPRLRSYLPFDAPDPRPVWAFFGNSFVQAPGMLADTARARLPGRRVFNLGRNEVLCVRLAQTRLLLENGLRPERLFVVLLPLDAASLGQDPLRTVHVTARGALTYCPRLPDGPLGWLTQRSALARTAWFRTGRHHAHPDFRPTQLNQGLPEELRADLDRLFGRFARMVRTHQTPVTIVLIPNFEQITAGAPFGFQDAFALVLRRHGLDVCDVREVFLQHPAKPSLFIPDKHFSELGNRVLLAELLRHLREIGVAAPAEADPS